MALKASCTVLTCAAIVSLAAVASPQGTLTLNDILQRLQDHLNRYDARVPSLICDEHVVSQVDPAPRNQSTVIDSMFRLKRETHSDGTTDLAESRDIQSVNGKPAKSQEMTGPSLLRGAFEGGLAVVSVKQGACMRYSLQSPGRGSSPAYVIRFTTALTEQNAADCLLQEKSSGRVFIDPASMQITHLELVTPKHVIIPGDAFSRSVVGNRNLTIDYAPVELGGEMFWMPMKIAMHAVSGEGTFHRTAWSYKASYSNYHRLQVSSHILPGPQ